MSSLQGGQTTATAMPAETRTARREHGAPRAQAVLALINAKPSSPTAEEIRNVLAPPQQAPVMAYEHTESPAEGGGCYELDMWTIAIYAHAASAYSS
jgi:hypothetical protein